MTAHRLRAALTASAAVLALATAGVPAHAQWIVFDPTNFSQNVLTAARELQQVNNEIQSLENQANMLINQAKNLASLPYSSLAQLEQSINQTEQLLIQAGRHHGRIESIFGRTASRPSSDHPVCIHGAHNGPMQVLRKWKR